MKITPENGKTLTQRRKERKERRGDFKIRWHDAEKVNPMYLTQGRDKTYLIIVIVALL